MNRVGQKIWAIVLIVALAGDYCSVGEFMHISHIWDPETPDAVSRLTVSISRCNDPLLVRLWFGAGIGATILSMAVVQPLVFSVLALLSVSIASRTLGSGASLDDHSAGMTAMALTLSAMAGTQQATRARGTTVDSFLPYALLVLLALRCGRVIWWLPQRPGLIPIAASGMVSGLVGPNRTWGFGGLVAGVVFAICFATASDSWVLSATMFAGYVGVILHANQERVDQARSVKNTCKIGPAEAICCILIALETCAFVATVFRNPDVWARTETVLSQFGIGGSMSGVGVAYDKAEFVIVGGSAADSIQVNGDNKRTRQLLRALDVETRSGGTGPLFAGFVRAYCRNVGHPLPNVSHATLTIGGAMRVVGYFDCSFLSVART